MKMFGKNTALSDIRCTGNALMGRLTPNTIAKISFITEKISGHYTSAVIKVIIRKAERSTGIASIFAMLLIIREKTIFISGLPTTNSPAGANSSRAKKTMKQ